MHPLLFVNWRSVNAMFRGLMWLVAVALATVVVIHLMAVPPAVHHSAQVLR